MAVTQEFIDAVNQGDILMVRIMLKDILMIDPTFVEFDEMLSLVNKKGLELYDKHNGEDLKYDESEWTEEYMDKQMINLLDNFSKERVSLLKDICKKLYSKRIQMIKDERRNFYNKKTKKNEVGAGVIIGGVIATTVGAIAVKPIVIAAGVSIMAIGGAVIIMGGE